MVTGLSPLETLQASLLLVFLLNLVNTFLFVFQKMVIWTWVIPIVLTGFLTSFLFSFFATSLSPFQLRFLLWLFLAILPLVFYLLKKFPPIKKNLPWLSGLLMGTCSGLTGLGGGILLSPLLHESRSLPTQKITPVISVATLLISFFALLGQEKGAGFSSNSSYWWICCFVLLAFAGVGLSFGHLLNKKPYSSTRRLLVRLLTLFVFCIVTIELWLMLSMWFEV